MGVNVAGLVVLVVFYLVIFVVGVLAARRKKQNDGTSQMESSIVADRNISTVVGIFTMTATTVGGGYINGTAESIATDGLVWTLAPLGIFIGLMTGGLIYAKPMRDKCYMTMLDPFHERFGNVIVMLVYLASLCGDLFWTASILSALGTSLSVIVNLDLTVAIVASAGVTVAYTMVGQMISVAYTDIVQLAFITFGLVLSVPFVLTNDNVGSISPDTAQWFGQVDSGLTAQWIDLLIAMTFGTIPWQAYFQRVLSVKTGKQAQILSMAGGLSALILVIPSVLIGAAGKAADWNTTRLGVSPMEIGKGSMILPYVLYEFTPQTVSVLGLGAISAAVMSSMDSAVLGSSSMFTYNIYKHIFRHKASEKELLWIQRTAIFVVGVIATMISIFVPIIYGMFILAADIVFVIVLPQLTCALFVKFSNSYGALCGFLVGFICRLGAGEYYLKFDSFIHYPWYSDEMGQVFPFRTFSMLCSFFTILLVSLLTNFIFSKHILPEQFDVLGIKSRQSYTYSAASDDLPFDTTERSHDLTCDQKEEEDATHDQSEGRIQKDIFRHHGDHVSVL
ncbi:high-affinity choline transporter 1-like [Mercenaria mercenaria]|uniref:high-affinity choline transporter 1-like n=1 Tax=Mercenaria mercenaria TaxID=6596 RepID=UPI00234E606C|nr:high-affinity choline transporter 1-like [Mercenaria mercenaria]